ncbi:MAG: hypothetical protein UX85_C0010G0005 [Candidatus Beckwithbacteria bacterium GW2011_GWB1_47_15]|uniref:Uncharacterized protein n=1 Tax=Candidatus Beckwithbacteria bacterium GW2011_GWB1_47_15 TaxID=1618371 RepID=A0A0G1RTI2_9BACT|nr:MAG: hypothetical protein UY43_C0001G0811 [Candidatus Beckwithbacteria bacterium GW2011_GWC1_49_16]AQS30953.1 hypothetical protein [uncultured bacterium]KKU34879.1 MAG: hypothetical protein UX50_C0009G0006 [Candidatus Beckwithbacteria bacterium GW2011_GWA1_46_30]KKU60472.1 MAG: hypothetical protein UX85_C0010G0005 [Candidatus Beckwithbacteria bacterium GW2011_GWB1_47_15]KKU72348.1 MAG: hypothetical protein UX97_C0001G0218 [Candidatus Beckwithbacteria bacterium GW2011_GWA2_47_25]OGD48240.1 M
MLTKTDITKIRKVVRDETESEAKTTRRELQGEIKLLRIELQKELKTITGRIKDLEGQTRKVRKDIELMLGFFDREYLDLQKRVDKVEERLGIASA